MNLPSFIQSPQLQARKPLLITLGCLALFAAGVGTGRYAAPSKAETRVVTVEKVRLQEHVRTEVQTVHDKAEAQDRIVNRVVTVTKEGATRTEEQIVYRDRVVEHHAEAKAQTVDRVVEKLVTIEKARIVTRDAPRWTVAAGAGAAIGVAPLGVGPVYFASVGWRPFGPLPVSVIAWGTFDQPVPSKPGTSAAVGLAVGLSF